MNNNPLSFLNNRKKDPSNIIQIITYHHIVVYTSIQLKPYSISIFFLLMQDYAHSRNLHFPLNSSGIHSKIGL